MANLKTHRDGRLYYVITHPYSFTEYNEETKETVEHIRSTHQHRIYLDELDLSDGSGQTVHFTHGEHGAPHHTVYEHSHDIVNWEVQPGIGASEELRTMMSEQHSHEDVTAADLILARTIFDFDADQEDAIVIEGDRDREAGWGTAPEPSPEQAQLDDVIGLDPGDPIEMRPVPSDAATRLENIGYPANPIDTSITPVDWTKRTKYEPHYIINKRQYAVAIEAPEDFGPGQEISNDSIYEGVIHLMNFYNKIPSSSQASAGYHFRTLRPVAGGPPELVPFGKIKREYLLTVRPNERSKILIKIPAFIFEKLPDRTPPYPLPDNFSHSNSFTHPGLMNKIEIVARSLERYDELAKRGCISVPGINLRAEARRMRKCGGKINKLFTDNKCQPERIEIGFDENNKIAYVEACGKDLRIGFDTFVNTDPQDHLRTLGYLSNLTNLTNLLSFPAERMPTLQEFLTVHTFPPCPKFRPSVGSDFWNRTGTRCPEPGDLDWDSLIPPLSLSLSCDDPRPFLDVQHSYTSASSLVEENFLIRSPEHSQAVSSETKNKSHYVGDEVVFGIPHLLDTLDGKPLKDVFKELLDKLDFGTLAGAAAAATMGGLPNVKDLLECALKVFFEDAREVTDVFVAETRELIDSLAGEPSADSLNNVDDFSTNFHDVINDKAASIDGIMEELCAFIDGPFAEIDIFPSNLVNVNWSDHLEGVEAQLTDIASEELESGAAAGMSLFLSVIEVAMGFAEEATNLGIREPTIGMGSLDGASPILDAILDMQKTAATALGSMYATSLLCGPVVALPCIKFPTMPELPELPTFDIMGWLMPNLLQIIKDLIAALFIALLSEILKSVISISGLDPAGVCSCLDADYNIDIGTNFDFGDLDFAKSLLESLCLDNSIEDDETFNEVLVEILRAFICNESEFLDAEETGGDLRSLLGEVSSSITSNEMIALMEGRIPTHVYLTIRNILMKEKYVNLREKFENSLESQAEVEDIFWHIATAGGSGAITRLRSAREARALDSLFQGPGPTRTLDLTDESQYGFPGLSNEDKRLSLFSQKFGDLAPEQIASEIDKIICRNRDSASKALQATNLPPPDFASVTSEILASVPSVKYMTERTIETVFESIVMSFEHTVHGPMGFLQSMCFRSGMRGIYESMRRADMSARRSILYTGFNIPFVPFHIPGPLEPQPPEGLGLVGPGWIDKAIELGGSSQRLSEVNEGILEKIKALLSAVEYPVSPGRGPAGEPRSLSITLPTSVRPVVWNFKNLDRSGAFKHELNVPAPNFRPYQSDSVLKIESRQEIDVDAYGDILEDVDSSNPIAVFSEVALKGFEDLLSDINRRPIKVYLEDTAYYRTLADIMKSFTNQILKSDIFSKKVEPYNVTDNGSELNFVSNPSAISNWRLESNSDKNGRTQTTLLGLEDLREKAKEKIEKYRPKKGDEAGLGLKNAITETAIEAIIRLQVIEIFLKTLPVLDIFNKNDIIGEEFLGYVSKKIQESCVRQDPFFPGYYEDVLDYAKILYTQKWNDDGGKDPDTDPPEDITPPEEIEPESALKYLIKKTVRDMSEEIMNVSDIGFRPGERGPVEKIFLNQMMKFSGKTDGIFDVPRKVEVSGDDLPWPGDPDFVYEDRFEEIVLDRGTNRRAHALFRAGQIPEGERTSTRIAGEDVMDPIDIYADNQLRSGLEKFEDGGLLLEKYIQYKKSGKTKIISIPEAEEGGIPSGATQIKVGLRMVYMPELSSTSEDTSTLDETGLVLAAQDQLEEHGHSLTVRFTDQGSESIDFAEVGGRRVFVLTGDDHEHFIDIEELDFDAASPKLEMGRTFGYHTTTPLGSNYKEHEHDIQTLEQLFVDGTSGHRSIATLIRTTEHGEAGHHLQHTHTNVTVEELLSARNLLEIETSEPDRVVREIPPTIRERADDMRTFHILERFESKMDKIRVTNDGDLQHDDAEDVSIYRWTYPVPLVEVTVPLAENIEDFSFSEYKQELIDNMIADHRFSLLFKHCFPLQRILSIMTIYIEVVFSSSADAKLTTVFDQVKEMLRSIFDNTRNMNNYKHRDRNIESVGGNSGLHRGTVDGRFRGTKKVFSGGRPPVVFENNEFTHEEG